MKEIAVQNFNRGERDRGWNPQPSVRQELLIYDLIVINTFFSSFCNDKAFAIKTLPSFWNPQDDKWPGPPWGGEGRGGYFTFLVIYYGFGNIAGVKSSLGREKRGTKRKSFQQKISFCRKRLGLSPITVDVSWVLSSRGLGIPEYLDSLCHITGKEIKPTPWTRTLLCRNG